MKRFFLLFILFICGYLSLQWTIDYLSGDFSLENITYNLPDKPHLDSPNKLEFSAFKDMCQQPFSFLGMGRQTYVFESADKEYVLKFFRFKRLKPYLGMPFLAHIPGCQKFFHDYEIKRYSRLKKLFGGYWNAFTHDPEHTGIKYIHLNATDHLNTKVKVLDAFGFEHQINLDDVVFAIQLRGKMTKDILAKSLSEGDLEKVKWHLSQLLHMIIAEYKKGVLDLDHNVIYNTGFVNEMPIRLDVGQLTYDDAVKYNFKSDFEIVVKKRILGWLKRHYPHEAEKLEPFLNQLFEMLVQSS